MKLITCMTHIDSVHLDKQTNILVANIKISTKANVCYEFWNLDFESLEIYMIINFKIHKISLDIYLN